ncbi:MAG: ASCH domain-containing protein [Sporichthyaceae bacterium]
MTGTVRTPLPPHDQAAATAMWAGYAADHPATAAGETDPPVSRFGDSVELADELLGLVTQGPKRATAGLVADFVAEREPLPRIGGHWVVCDGAGTPRVVLRSTELRVGVLESVDDAFAWDEGEGDRSRAYWLAAHRDFFARMCATRGTELTDDLEVVFERFRVVWPPALAD